jgi:hypothetical protein
MSRPTLDELMDIHDDAPGGADAKMEAVLRRLADYLCDELGITGVPNILRSIASRADESEARPDTEDVAQNIKTATEALRRFGDACRHIASVTGADEPKSDIAGSLRGLAPFIRIVSHHIHRSLADGDAMAELRAATGDALAALEGKR